MKQILSLIGVFGMFVAISAHAVEINATTETVPAGSSGQTIAVKVTTGGGETFRATGFKIEWAGADLTLTSAVAGNHPFEAPFSGWVVKLAIVAGNSIIVNLNGGADVIAENQTATVLNLTFDVAGGIAAGTPVPVTLTVLSAGDVDTFTSGGFSIAAAYVASDDGEAGSLVTVAEDSRNSPIDVFANDQVRDPADLTQLQTKTGDGGDVDVVIGTGQELEILRVGVWDDANHDGVVDGGEFTAGYSTATQPPARGDESATVWVDGDGAAGQVVRYTPGNNFNGTDTFWYEAVRHVAGAREDVTSVGKVTVTVTPVNDIPQLQTTANGNEGSWHKYTEGDGAVNVFTAVTVVDPDFSDDTPQANYNGAKFYAVIENAQAGDTLSYAAAAVLRSSDITLDGTRLIYQATEIQATEIGDFVRIADGSIRIDLDNTRADITPTMIQALVNDLKFENASDAPSDAERLVRVFLDDAPGADPISHHLLDVDAFLGVDTGETRATLAFVGMDLQVDSSVRSITIFGNNSEIGTTVDQYGILTGDHTTGDSWYNFNQDWGRAEWDVELEFATWGDMIAAFPAGAPLRIQLNYWDTTSSFIDLALTGLPTTAPTAPTATITTPGTDQIQFDWANNTGDPAAGALFVEIEGPEIYDLAEDEFETRKTGGLWDDTTHTFTGLGAGEYWAEIFVGNLLVEGNVSSVPVELAWATGSYEIVLVGTTFEASGTITDDSRALTDGKSLQVQVNIVADGGQWSYFGELETEFADSGPWGYSFNLPTVPAGYTHYVIQAYIDRDQNGMADLGEPVGQSVNVTATGTDFNISLAAQTRSWTRDWSLLGAAYLYVAPVNDPPVNTERPSITGTTQYGQTLTATNGTWNDDKDAAPAPTVFAYQWYGTGGPLAGENGQTLITDNYVGLDIYVRVTATDTGIGEEEVPRATASATADSPWVKIDKAPATVTISNATQTYDGAAKPVTITTVPAGLTVVVTYDGLATVPTDVKAGGYAVVATVNDANYEGTASGTLTIAKATATVTLSDTTQTYDGAAKTVTVTTVPGGLAVDVVYGVARAALTPTDAGDYTVAATVNEPNYEGTANGTLTIEKAVATVTLSNTTQTYDGAAKFVTVTTVPAGLTVDVTYDGSATVPAGAKAGGYAVVATVNENNYQGTANGTLTIAKAVATVTITNTTPTYDGTAKPVTITTVPAGLTVDVTYDGSATVPTDVKAGGYAVVATVNETNYQGTANATLTIAKATATVTITNTTLTYDGAAKPVTITTVPAGLTVDVTYDGLATVPTDVKAGGYAVVATVNDANYEGTANATLTIAKATAAVTLSDTTQTYDGTAKTVTVSTVPAGLTVDVVYGIAREEVTPTDAGDYTVAATVNDTNYEGTANGTLTIEKATATVTLSDTTQTYDGTGKSVTVTTVPAGLAVDVTYDGSATPPTASSSYPLVATVNEANYQGTANGTFIIEKAIATVTITNTAPTYDGTAKPVTITTVPAGLTVDVTYDGSATVPTDVKAGGYVVVATVNETNYQGTANATLTIAKAAATVTITNTAPTYDSAAKPVTIATVPAGLTVDVTYDGSATVPIDVKTGGYAVVATVNEANYQGTANDTLVIAKAPLTIKADDANRSYFALNSTIVYTATFTGLVGEDVQTDFDGLLTFSTDASDGTARVLVKSPHDIDYETRVVVSDPTAPPASNYDLRYEVGVLDITDSAPTRNEEGTFNSLAHPLVVVSGRTTTFDLSEFFNDTDAGDALVFSGLGAVAGGTGATVEFAADPVDGNVTFDPVDTVQGPGDPVKVSFTVDVVDSANPPLGPPAEGRTQVTIYLEVIDNQGPEVTAATPADADGDVSENDVEQIPINEGDTVQVSVTATDENDPSGDDGITSIHFAYSWDGTNWTTLDPPVRAGEASATSAILATDMNSVSAAEDTKDLQVKATITDGASVITVKNWVFTVTNVNVQPTLADIADVNVKEDNLDGDSLTVLLTATNGGETNDPAIAGDEIPGRPPVGAQITASSSDTDIVTIDSIIEQRGTFLLTYGLKPDANGTVTVTVTVNDGTGADNATVEKTFDIAVSAVNDAPSFVTGGNVTVDEDSGAYSQAWATSVSAGPADEAGQTLQFSVTGNTNSALFSTPPAVAADGRLTFTPAEDANGAATITVVLADNDATPTRAPAQSAPIDFTITVTAKNDRPTFTGGGDVTVLEDSGAYDQPWASAIVVGPADESGQTPTFTAVATLNAALFTVQPSVSADGRLSFTPAADAFGSATVSVTLMDDGGTDDPARGADHGDTSAAVVFTVNVTPVNDAPVITTDPVVFGVAEDDPDGTSVALLAADDKEGNVRTWTIEANSSFSIDPATAEIKVKVGAALDHEDTDVYHLLVTVTDDGVPAETDTVTVTINVADVNEPPVAAADYATAKQGETIAIPVLANDSDPDDGDALDVGTVTIVSPVVGGTATPEADGTVTFQATPGFTGTATFTYTVDDGFGLTSNEATVDVVVGSPPWYPLIPIPGAPLGRAIVSFVRVRIADAAGNTELTAVLPIDNTAGELIFRPEDYMTGEGAATAGLLPGTYTPYFAYWVEGTEDFGEEQEGGSFVVSYEEPTAPTGVAVNVRAEPQAVPEPGGARFSFQLATAQGYVLEVAAGDARDLVTRLVRPLTRPAEGEAFPVALTVTDLFISLVPGDYSWRVRAYNPLTTATPALRAEAWADGNAFAVAAPAPAGAPGAPDLLSPGAGIAFNPSATTGKAMVDLFWTAVPGATGYYVYVGLQEGTAVVNNQKTTEPSLPAVSLRPGTYRWAAMAYNAAGRSVWSGVGLFTVNAAPGPALVTGAYAQGNIAFNWVGIAPQAVELYVVDEGAYKAWMVSDLPPNQPYAPSGELAVPGHTYWFRTRSIAANGDRGVWSDWDVYQVPQAGDQVLVAATPDTTVAGQVTFTWAWTNMPAGAQVKIRVTRASNLASGVWTDATGTDGLVLTGETVAAPGETYYYQTRPLDADGKPLNGWTEWLLYTMPEAE